MNVPEPLATSFPSQWMRLSAMMRLRVAETTTPVASRAAPGGTGRVM